MVNCTKLYANNSITDEKLYVEQIHNYVYNDLIGFKFMDGSNSSSCCRSMKVLLIGWPYVEVEVTLGASSGAGRHYRHFGSATTAFLLGKKAESGRLLSIPILL